jgi:protein O-mannosyl-transferase
LTLTAYLPAIRGGFIWDDDSYVTENAQLRDAGGLARIWFQPSATPQYYPLVHTSFWIERHLWGLHPLGFHLVNVLLHVLSALLLWRILALLGVGGALLAAAVFAVHPVHVESVAWITERKNVLSGVFYLAAALMFLRARLEAGVAPRGGGGTQPDRVSFFLFVCALLSKTVTASLPIALLLVLWWKRGRVRWEDGRSLLPMLGAGLLMGILTAWMEKHHVGAVGAEWRLDPIERLLVAGRAIWFYASKLIWPARLTFSYPRWQVDSGNPWQYLFPLYVAGAAVVLWRLRHRIGLGPLTGWLFTIVTLGPALGFLDVYPFRYSFVADHFQYLASIGLIAVLVAAGDRLLTLSRLRRREAGWIAGAVLCIVLGSLTWRQGGIYRDQETLWTDTLTKNPTSWMAHNNLGRILLLRRDLDRAIDHFNRAIEAKPDYFEAYLNRGNAWRRKGDLQQALRDYQRASELEPRDPAPFYNQGNAYQAMEETDKAIEAYGRALTLGLDDAGLYVNRGNAYLVKGDLESAVADFTRALARRSDSTEAYNNRAVAYFRMKDYDRAWADVRSCRRIGGTPNERFLQELAKISGRSN